MTQLEQKMFAKSGKKANLSSLTTVLKQALQSEDVDQIEWVLSQCDPALVDSTLQGFASSSSKDIEYVRKFFK